MTDKLMERRRADVRDQMMELSSKNTVLSQLQPESPEEAARQRRAAEREGRRRRRHQKRQLQQRPGDKHNDGMSSDDELSSHDQATLATTRQDIENQAREVLSDVVDEFSTIRGVQQRFEEWKQEDPDSYSDAFVSLCLPKIFSPLVRLQMLFWNPLADQTKLEQTEWFKALATFSLKSSESMADLAKDPDRKLVALIVEKVVLPKVSAFTNAAYDPLSYNQSRNLTTFLKKCVEDFPTLKGNSKQVRELMIVIRDKLKTCIDHDPYIPIGYAKQ